MTKLKEIFPNFLTQGVIFKTLEANNRLPWASVYSGADQDIEYIARSGNKFIAPLLSVFVADGSISPDNLSKLCDIIWGRFGKKWTNLWNTMQIEYDPLRLFHVKTTENITRDNTGTVTDDRNIVSNKTGSSDSVSSNTNIDNIYGYNSVNHSPSGDSVGSDTGNVSYKDDGRVTDDNTRTLDTNELMVRTNEREGNVGLVSAQSLIKQELEIKAYDLFKIVYKDLDSLLVLSIYESEV